MSLLRHKNCVRACLDPSPSPKELPLDDPTRSCRLILVANDLTPSSSVVFSHALAIARQTGARILIAHVDDPASQTPLTYMPEESYEQWTKDCQDLVRRAVEPLAAMAEKAGIHTEILSLTGSLGAAILETARSRGVDLIVIGFYRRSKLTRAFMGSTALDVLKGSDCPVLVVPLPIKANQRTSRN